MNNNVTLKSIKMKKNILALLLLLASSPIFAHYMWIETVPTGKLNKEHQIKVRFGEYTYGVLEKVDGDAFKGVSEFTVWIIAPNGQKKELTLTPGADFYAGTFVPSENGTYTVVLDNKNMKVLDYTEYDFGIFKPQYHAKARIVVGETIAPLATSNPEGIEIVDLTDKTYAKADEVVLQLLYKGKPLAKNELSVYQADMWSKKLTTDEEGKVSFKLPWNTQYTVEATYNEEVPGNFKGLDYGFVWHCATYCIPAPKN